MLAMLGPTTVMIKRDPFRETNCINTSKSPSEKFERLVQRQSWECIRPRNHIREGVRVGAGDRVPQDSCCTKCKGVEKYRTSTTPCCAGARNRGVKDRPRDMHHASPGTAVFVRLRSPGALHYSTAEDPV